MKYLQYFEEQYNNARILLPEDAELFIKRRIDLGYNAKEVRTYFEKRIGQKLLYFILHANKSPYSHILKTFEDDMKVLEEFCDGSYKSVTQTLIPIFRANFIGSIKRYLEKKQDVLNIKEDFI
jgi:hypothetical protein